LKVHIIRINQGAQGAKRLAGEEVGFGSVLQVTKQVGYGLPLIVC
jgi:hypothetical protein